MRTTLITATLAALIALGTLPAMAAESPGHDAPGANGLGITLQVDYDGSWQNPNGAPSQPSYGNPDGNRDWQSSDQPNYGNPYGNRNWQNPDSYNQPSWGWGNGGWGNGGYNQHRQPLPEWVIRHRIARQHFHDIGRLKLKNGYYRVNAEDWRGRDVRLIVDAYNGRILEVQRR
jgi:hypothetical protein